MADQPDDSSSNGEPPIKFNPIDWKGPVVVSGPVSHDHIDAYGSNAGSADHGPEESAVDTPVSTSSVDLFRTNSTIGEGISEGRIRDSLELPKYLPPNRLGVRRASQAGSTAAAAAAAAAAVKPAEEEGELPTKARPEGFAFRVPATMPRGDEPRRRGLGPPSYALNVVQPYPNPTGLKKKRAAPINLGPLPERLLKRHKTAGVSVSHTPGGSVITTKALGLGPQGEQSKNRDVVEAGDAMTGDVNAAKAPAEEAPRRFGPVGVIARKIRKDKAKGKSVASEAKGKAPEIVETGESARGMENHAANEAQVGAAQEARDGEQSDNGIDAVRKVRKAVGRYLKVTA